VGGRLRSGPPHENLRLPSHFSSGVVATGKFIFIFLYRAHQRDVIGSGGGIEVVKFLFRFLENLAGSIRFVYLEFVPFHAIIRHSALLLHVGQRDDACDIIWVESHRPIPWYLVDDVGGGTSGLRG
jgi:hypothetical protein